MNLSIDAIITGNAGDRVELVARGRIDSETATELEAAVEDALSARIGVTNSDASFPGATGGVG